MLGCIITAIVLVWIDCGKIMEKQKIIIENQKEMVLKINSLYRNQKAPLKILGKEK